VLTFELTDKRVEDDIQPPVLVPAYNPTGRKAAANWKAYQEYKSVEREKLVSAAGVGEAVDNDDDVLPSSQSLGGKEFSNLFLPFNCAL